MEFKKRKRDFPRARNAMVITFFLLRRFFFVCLTKRLCRNNFRSAVAAERGRRESKTTRWVFGGKQNDRLAFDLRRSCRSLVNKSRVKSGERDINGGIRRTSGRRRKYMFTRILRTSREIRQNIVENPCDNPVSLASRINHLCVVSVAQPEVFKTTFIVTKTIKK